MSEEAPETKIRARIKELNDLAMAAFKAHDFDREDAYDREAQALREKLPEYQEEMQPEEPLTEADLAPHAWRQDCIDRYGNDRCMRCGMQYRYFRDNLDALSRWPERDKHTKRFNNAMKLCSCWPRRIGGLYASSGGA
jgi:hypothetical protein